MQDLQQIKEILDNAVARYNCTSFIEKDPISIPHLFSRKEDIEIAGFLAAIFSWGSRSIIIHKSMELLKHMDMAPYDFILHHQSSDLKRLAGFKHRTFTDTDILYFIHFLHQHYRQYASLETAFTNNFSPDAQHVEPALETFRIYFFSYPHLVRTEKHITCPLRGSACKRLNMFLRWMVRSDKSGVDFGLWKRIRPSQLVCPIDVHVANTAHTYHLIQRKKVDWLMALELTEYLRSLDEQDPVKYDFALFGLGIMQS